MIQEQEDRLYNALAVGMTALDAYSYAGLKSDEIAKLENDIDFQRFLRQKSKELEYDLLLDQRSIARRGLISGNGTANQWLLEKLFPRYSAKAADSAAIININTGTDSIEVLNHGENVDNELPATSPSREPD